MATRRSRCVTFVTTIRSATRVLPGRSTQQTRNLEVRGLIPRRLTKSFQQVSAITCRAFTMAIMVLLLAILLPAPAHAQFFVEASGGKQMNQDADLALTQPTLSTNVRFKSVEWDDESFTPPPYYGYGFGYFLESAPWFGIRAEFRHQKVIARTNQSYPATGMLDGQTVDRNIQLDEIVQDLGSHSRSEHHLGGLYWAARFQRDQRVPARKNASLRRPWYRRNHVAHG